MDEIDEYKSRIFAALDKISDMAGKPGQAIAVGADTSAHVGELEALLAAGREHLAVEKANVAELSKQVQKWKDRSRDTEDNEEELEVERAKTDKAMAEVDRLRSEIAKLQAEADAPAPPAGGAEDQLKARIVSQDLRVQRLKDANAHLRVSNAKLRELNLENLADKGAINTSPEAELNALKEARAADVEEMDAILAELKPMVEGGHDA